MKTKVAGAALTAAAVVYLHMVLSVFFWIIDFKTRSFLAPTWEITGLLILVLAWACLRAEAAPRAFHGILTAVVTLYLLLGLGQGFARREFGYDVVLALHIPYVPELFRMMYNAEPLGMFLLYVAILVGGTALAVTGIYTAIRRIHRQATVSRRSLAVLASACVLYIAATAPFMGVNGPLSRVLIQQVDMAMNLDDRIGSTGQKMAVEASRMRRQNPFKSLERPPNILIFIVESYGHALFNDPDFGAYQRQAQNLEKQLTEAGYHIRSSYLESPVFGGSSWMADATLLCGVRVHDQRRFEGLFTAPLSCMPKLLNEAGYWTVTAASNTTRLEERFPRLFPYDRIYYLDNLEYQGPRMSWSYMPDQYVIQFIHEREVVTHPDDPLLVTYVLTSSHHPWDLVPPYIQDWDSIGDGSLYHRVRGKYFQNRFVTGKQFKPGFMSSIIYSMRSVTEYLVRHPKDDTLIIILGDHQPRTPVANMHEDSWAVPIHIVSRDPALVERFVPFGYAPGIEPPADMKPTPMERFLVDLFKAFSPAPG